MHQQTFPSLKEEQKEVLQREEHDRRIKEESMVTTEQSCVWKDLLCPAAVGLPLFYPVFQVEPDSLGVSKPCSYH